ncbi:MAG: protein kinase [Myxococcota bacterium]
MRSRSCCVSSEQHPRAVGDRYGGFAYGETAPSLTQGRPTAVPRSGPMETESETKVIDRESRSEAAPAPVLEPLAVGKTVGRYELVHRLGHGGMAAVFLGRATGRAGFEKLVAVKVIHPHLAVEQEFVEMFLDEARIAARLHHPHIVEIHDLGEDDGVFFMVMEYVEGETLASLLRQLRKHDELLALPAALQIMADACGGLAAAHDETDANDRPMQLVHRDVSPHNLLVGMDGRVKVVDFGIAKASGRRSSTRTGQLRGKLAYMSPEQASNQKIDHRTDLFALGAVLWELLTNQRLFMAETESETLARVTACEVPDISEKRDDLPDGVVKLVQRALARDPDDRFESAQQMLKEIRSLLRALQGDSEPREDVSRVMTNLFKARIDYVRAAVRRASESGPRPSAANDPISPHDATRATDRPPEAPAPARRPSSSSLSTPASLVGTTTGTQTLTTSLATAPARHWSLWLLLPAIGAVLGAVAVTKWLGPDETQEIARGTEPRPSLASSTDTEPEPTRPVVAPMVTWRFDIDPPGAVVKLDGVAHAELSPFTLELPRSHTAIEIEISKPGFVSKTLHPVPAGYEYFDQRLEPERPVAEVEPPPATPPHKSGVWLKAKTKKAKQRPDASPGPGESEPSPKTTSPGEVEHGDGRKPAPMPDFKSFFEENGSSGS